MTRQSRLLAALAYVIPIVGWLYLYFFQRKNELVVYHLKQAIGLFVFLLGAIAGWAVIAWLLAWIPYMAILSIALFSLVMAAYFYGLVAWALGIINALGNRLMPLPLFGRWANRLPIKELSK